MKRKILFAGAVFLALAVTMMLSQEGRSRFSQDRQGPQGEVAIGVSSAQEDGPVYSLEGAWYGIGSIVGMGQVQTLDTFTSNAQRQGAEGTFLCTGQGAFKMPHPLHMGDSNYWTGMTNSAHGNWVRLDKNKYAFSAVRIVFDQNAGPLGWAKFWGTITPISVDEYTGTLNYQFYYLDGTPYWPPRAGTLHSHRVEITFE